MRDFQPTADDDGWLREYAKITGQPVSVILTSAVAALRRELEAAEDAAEIERDRAARKEVRG